MGRGEGVRGKTMEPEAFREVENPGRCYEKAMRIEMRKGMGGEGGEGGVGEVGCRGRGGNWTKRTEKGQKHTEEIIEGLRATMC